MQLLNNAESTLTHMVKLPMIVHSSAPGANSGQEQNTQIQTEEGSGHMLTTEK